MAFRTGKAGRLWVNGEEVYLKGFSVRRKDMTEAEWEASEDPAAMLAAVDGHLRTYSTGHQEPVFKASDRKLRLFACACVREVWQQLLDEWSTRAVIIAERHVDGLDDSDRMFRMHTQAFRVPGSEQPGPIMAAAECCNRSALRAAEQAAQLSIGSLVVRANLLRDIVGNPFRPVTLPRNPDCSACRGSGTFAVGNGEDAERMRCRCCPWLTPAVVSLAHAAYDHRDEQTGHLDPFRLALVADALEEAGCPLGDDPPKTLHKCPHCGSPGRYCSICYGTSKVLAACGTCLDKKRIWTGMDGMKWYPCGVCPKPTPHPILAHLRGQGPHVRGCQVIDLLTGRE